jgi:dynein heavy chain
MCRHEIELVNALVNEADVDYAKAMNQLVFNDVVLRDPSAYPADISIAPPPVQHVPTSAKAAPPVPGFADTKHLFAVTSLLQQPEIVAVLGKLTVECNKVVAMTLFQCKIAKYVKLEEFQTMQAQASDLVATHVRGAWVTECRKAIQSSLGPLSKGWYNLAETSQQVYEVSKLKKFLQLTKFLMHDTLRSLVQV